MLYNVYRVQSRSWSTAGGPSCEPLGSSRRRSVPGSRTRQLVARQTTALVRSLSTHSRQTTTRTTARVNRSRGLGCTRFWRLCYWFNNDMRIRITPLRRMMDISTLFKQNQQRIYDMRRQKSAYETSGRGNCTIKQLPIYTPRPFR